MNDKNAKRLRARILLLLGLLLLTGAVVAVNRFGVQNMIVVDDDDHDHK